MSQNIGHLVSCQSKNVQKCTRVAFLSHFDDIVNVTVYCQFTSGQVVLPYLFDLPVLPGPGIRRSVCCEVCLFLHALKWLNAASSKFFKNFIKVCPKELAHVHCTPTTDWCDRKCRKTYILQRNSSAIMSYSTYSTAQSTECIQCTLHVYVCCVELQELLCLF